jgi:hypothetical protein
MSACSGKVIADRAYVGYAVFGSGAGDSVRGNLIGITCLSIDMELAIKADQITHHLTGE